MSFAFAMIAFSETLAARRADGAALWWAGGREWTDDPAKAKRQGTLNAQEYREASQGLGTREDGPWSAPSFQWGEKDD